MMDDRFITAAPLHVSGKPTFLHTNLNRLEEE
jgi:hypothetical protein